MSNQIESFLSNIWSQFPDLQNKEFTDVTDREKFATLDDHIDAKYVNFEAKRKDLYRLSMMIENYAQRAYSPLLATFETESLYKYVEDRYVEILKNIPKAWIVGGFDNPFFAPRTPVDTAELLTCAGTTLQNMWIVITKGPDGPFGLVAEDLGGDRFRGFFTTHSKILFKVIDKINGTMMTDIDFKKSEWNIMEQ
ncbi:MAG: hypothetical protein HKM23_08455 [Nitrosopumilus sp.]|nr:hypothetical protein [Nitrosopumilus sp.]NNL57873.1 hypothetical protein [Nitrosopumilus sp.]